MCTYLHLALMKTIKGKFLQNYNRKSFYQEKLSPYHSSIDQKFAPPSTPDF